MKHKIDIEHRMSDTKLLWHMDRVRAFYDRGERITPILINIGATKKCNLRCVYCYGIFQQRKNAIIEREPLLKLFEHAPKLGVRSMEIIGDGEPTLNPHIYDAMDIGKKNGLDMAFSTNGVLLDSDEKRENVLRNCVWMRFNLSAGTREGYKKIHNYDGFDKVTENASRMIELKKEKEYGCEIGLQAVYVPWLMNKEMIEESKLAVRLGVDYLVIKQCSLPDGNEGVADVKFNVDDYDNPKIVRILKRCEGMSTEDTKIIVKWSHLEQKGRRPYNRCVDVPLLFQVSGDGKCYPCGYLFGNEKFCYGDLNKNSLEEILSSEKYWGIVKQMIEEFDVHKDCKGSCRHDKCNEFIWNYLNNKPKGINFI